MDWSHTLSRKRKEEKIKEQNVSKGVLLRMFNEHQLESLSDIADTYRKIEASLGYRTMRFQEYMSSSGIDSGADALHRIDEIRRWQEQCGKWGLDPDGVVMLARDHSSISRIMRELRYPRSRVILHQQCCLTVWSVNMKRCGIEELHKNIERMGRDDLNKN